MQFLYYYCLDLMERVNATNQSLNIFRLGFFFGGSSTEKSQRNNPLKFQNYLAPSFLMILRKSFTLPSSKGER